ncbi:MAG: PAS domain S-box protein [Candidatus Omnitrophota bacterium]
MLKQFLLSLIRISSSVVALILVTGACSFAAEPLSHYEIGVLADHGKDAAVKEWSELADYLTEASKGEEYFSIVPLYFTEILPAVHGQEVDFIIANPSALIELSYFYNIQNIASLKRLVKGKEYSYYGGVIFTKADHGDIENLADLKGKVFASSNESSFCGWLVVAREFQKAGWNWKRGFRALKFLGTHEAVVNAVLKGEVDAGSVRTGVLEKMEEQGKISLNNIKVLHVSGHKQDPGFLLSTDLFPEWSIAKLDHVSDLMAQQVAQMLFVMPINIDEKATLDVGGWSVAYNYASVRRAVRDLQEGALLMSKAAVLRAFFIDYWHLITFLLIVVIYMVMITMHRTALNRTLQQSKTALEKELAEHQRAESSLKESRAMLQSVLDLIPVRVFWKDRNSVYLGANGQFLKDASLQHIDQLIGKTDFDLVWKEEAAHYQEDDKRVMESGQALYNIMEQQSLSNGSKAWLRTNKIPMLNHDGNITGLLGTYEDITRAKSDQEALKKSEAKYRELVENANSIILRINHKGEITFFNEYAQRFFGYREEEVIGKNVSETILPASSETAENLKEIIEGITKDNYKINENENVKKNGERVWISWSNKVITNEKGEREILSVGTDITQRRIMEEDLLRLSHALEQSQNIIVITNTQGDIEYVNPKFSEVTGYERGDALGKNPRILKSGELSQAVYERLWNTITTGGTWRGEFHNKKKNGELFWERGTISPVKDKTGKIINYLAVKEDITQEKRLAQDLQKAFGRLKEMERIINLTNAIVFMWSPGENGRVKFVSENIRILGIRPENFYNYGMKIQDIIFDDDRAAAMETIRQNINSKRLEFSQQYRVKGSDGKIRWFEEHSFVAYTKNQPESIQGVVFDITDRKIAEERMIEAVNMKSEFISIVSHELRTPLTAVKEGINIVYEGETGDLNEEQKKFLAIAKRNVDRLGTLINDVLDYQKLDMGKLNFYREEVDVRALVIEVKHSMEILAQNKGLALNMILPEGEIPKVYVDPGRIIQVLNNLVNNAIKFTDGGRVTIEVAERPEGIQVFVRDTGIGIRPGDMHKLFQTFSQIRSGSERSSGATGLGLAISKKIIDFHGGSIWVESVFGKGSAFTFILPKGKPVEKAI